MRVLPILLWASGLDFVAKGFSRGVCENHLPGQVTKRRCRENNLWICSLIFIINVCLGFICLRYDPYAQISDLIANMVYLLSGREVQKIDTLRPISTATTTTTATICAEVERDNKNQQVSP